MDRTSLFPHKPHPHRPRNANHLHAAELNTLNDQLAVVVTKSVGTMWTAYVFSLLAVMTISGVLGLLGVVSPLVAAVGAAISQTFIQLVLLPIIMVGQRVQSRHAEIQADEAYQATVKSAHDVEQILLHLAAQDEELLRQTELIQRLLEGR